jgi:toxin ParE1/3/4
MATVVWTPAAEEDLETIFLYIGRDLHSPAAAARVVHEIAEKAGRYATRPLLAAARPEFGPDVRAFFMHRYVIVYRPAPGGIVVLRVIHGSRDVVRILRQRDA